MVTNNTLLEEERRRREEEEKRKKLLDQQQAGDTATMPEKEPELPRKGVVDDIPSIGLTGLSKPIPREPQAPVTIPPSPLPQGSPVWYKPEEIQAGQYDTPAIPQKFGNQYLNRTAQDVYKSLGLEQQNMYGTIYGALPEEGGIRPTILPDKYFNHNVPLAIWLDDNTIVKADNPQQFSDLLIYAQNNQKYLPTSVYDESVGAMSVNQLNPEQLRDYIDTRKSFDTPARQEYEYYQTLQSIATNYEADVARLETLLADQLWMEGDTIPSGLTGEPAAIAARIKRRQGRTPDMKSLTDMSQAATERYINELNTQFPVGIVAEIDEQGMVRQRLESPYEASMSNIMLKMQDWSYNNGSFTNTQGKTLTRSDINASPELTDEYRTQLGDSVQEYVQWAQNNEDSFMSDLAKYGDTPETRIVFNEVFPDVEEEAVNRVFERFRTPQQIAEQGLREAEEIRDIVNQPYSDENERRLNELLPPFFRSTGGITVGLNASERGITPSFTAQQNGEIFRPTIKSGYLRSLYSGFGNLETAAAGIAGRAGWDGISQNMFTQGSKLQALAMPETDNVFMNYAYMGIQQIPMIVSMLPLALLGAAGGTAVASAAGVSGLAAAGGITGAIGTYGTAVLEAIGATALSRPIESLQEAGDTYNRAVTKGYSQEQANQVFDQVFWRNMSLAGMDAVQWGIAFLPMPAPLKKALNNSKLANVVMTGGKVVFNGLTEGGEEALQSYLQSLALGEPVQNEELVQAGILGGLMGMVYGGVGDVYANIQNRTIENLPVDIRIDAESEIADAIASQESWSQEQQDAWQQFMEENPEGGYLEFDAWAKGQPALKDTISGVAQAKKQVLDKVIAENPELAATVEAAVNEVKQEVISDEIQRSQERLAQMQETQPTEETQPESGVVSPVETQQVSEPSPPTEAQTPPEEAQQATTEIEQPAPEVATTETAPKPKAETQPIGKGEERESAAFKRINEGLDGIIGDNPVYQQMNQREEINRAIEFVNANEAEALNIINGIKSPPAGMLKQSISMAYFDKKLQTGDSEAYSDTAYKLTMQATRYGQETVILRNINDNSPLYFMKQLVQYRMQKASIGGKVSKKIENGVKKIKDVSKMKMIDMQAAQKLIDELTC
jgi:hypothetical protein